MLSSKIINILAEGNPAGMPNIIESLGPNLPNFIAHIIATIVIIIILSKLVYTPFRKMIANRRNKINELLDDAAEKQTLANKTQADAIEILKAAKIESQQIINEARSEADQSKNQILDSAKQEASDLQKHAEKSIERERSNAQEEIRKSIIDLAFEAANKVVGKTIDEKENEKLVKDFLDNLDKQ